MTGLAQIMRLPGFRQGKYLTDFRSELFGFKQFGDLLQFGGVGSS